MTDYAFTIYYRVVCESCDLGTAVFQYEEDAARDAQKHGFIVVDDESGSMNFCAMCMPSDE